MAGVWKTSGSTSSPHFALRAQTMGRATANGRWTEMTRHLGAFAVATSLLVAVGAGPASAQKAGGILRMYDPDSPASMSIHEEGTIISERPMMGVFNNLVMYDQHVNQNSLASIVPDLATSWSWNEEGTELTFPLRQGVKWHDGAPFTAADVKCTFDLLMDTAKHRLRINSRKSWYVNVAEVTTNGDYEVSFHLKRPQPAFLALLATSWSPIYPCHVGPRGIAHPPDRHRPVQICRVRAQRA